MRSTKEKPNYIELISEKGKAYVRKISWCSTGNEATRVYKLANVNDVKNGIHCPFLGDLERDGYKLSMLSPEIELAFINDKLSMLIKFKQQTKRSMGWYGAGEYTSHCLILNPKDKLYNDIMEKFDFPIYCDGMFHSKEEKKIINTILDSRPQNNIPRVHRRYDDNFILDFIINFKEKNNIPIDDKSYKSWERIKEIVKNEAQYDEEWVAFMRAIS